MRLPIKFINKDHFRVDLPIDYRCFLQYLFRYIWRTNIWGSAARLEKELRQQLFKHFTEMDNLFYQNIGLGI
ncbi:hypothetical protein ACIL82_04955 [Enterococcus faecium]